MSTRVGKILEVTYEIKPNPASLIVRAKGEVTNIGWTNAVLHRRVYSSAPADGVWEYDLFADSPAERGDVAGAAMSFVEATNICNLRCLMCPYSIMKRKKDIYDLDLDLCHCSSYIF